MKLILILSLTVYSALGQTGTASIAGTVLDLKTQKPIPVAFVRAIQTVPPALSKTTKSGADGAFQLQGLAPGQYSICVQVSGDAYLDPCHWEANPTTVAVASGQAATGILVRLIAAAVVSIQVKDTQKVLNQKTKDGRTPDFTVGIWGPKGLYYPAHTVGSRGSAEIFQDGIVYQIGVPVNTSLKLQIASRDVKLGDAGGASLLGNGGQQAFQIATADSNAKSFAFTVLGLLP